MVPSPYRHGARLFAAALGFALAGGSAAVGLAQEARGESTYTHSSHRPDGYILSTDNHWLSSDVDMGELEASRARLHGSFLWFRRSGKAWLVDDEATLDRAVKLFEPLRALEPEQDALRDKERALDDRETALDDEEERIDAAMERLEASSGDEDDDDDAPAAPDARPSAEDDREREELAGRMGELRAKQRELHAEQRAIESDERELDAREDRLERDAESSLWKLMDETIANGTAREPK
ncbi:MAG TPA: hypothetical protein VH854_11835 [Thermoanaerobaculia bacterium]|jgi:chromosome segregation ATPase|nr:hypothetical protein [Thermoanaerobaculia bacterium]